MKNNFCIFIYSLALVALTACSNPILIKEKPAKEPFNYTVYLPQSYEESSRSYPVIYLIDSSPFYIGDYFTETKQTIRRLETFHDFPESIIVEVEVKHLYQYVTQDRAALGDWLAGELNSLITQQYRTLNHHIIAGFSYTAGGLMNSIALRESSFTSVVSLSPVFDSVHAVPEELSTLEVVPKNYVVFGNENHRLMQFYQPLVEAANQIDLVITSLPQENHQSVLIPGLRASLLKAFADYQLPSYGQFTQYDYTLKELMELSKQRALAYGVAPAQTLLSEVALAAAKTYTRLGKFDLAEQHWRFTKSEHKSYFMSQIIEEFERNKQTELAARAKTLSQKLGI